MMKLWYIPILKCYRSENRLIFSIEGESTRYRRHLMWYIYIKFEVMQSYYPQTCPQKHEEMPENNAFITLHVWVFVSCCSCPSLLLFCFSRVPAHISDTGDPNPQKRPINNFTLPRLCSDPGVKQLEVTVAAGLWSKVVKVWQPRASDTEARNETCQQLHAAWTPRGRPWGLALGNPGRPETSHGPLLSSGRGLLSKPGWSALTSVGAVRAGRA